MAKVIKCTMSDPYSIDLQRALFTIQANDIMMQRGVLIYFLFCCYTSTLCNTYLLCPHFKNLKLSAKVKEEEICVTKHVEKVLNCH